MPLQVAPDWSITYTAKEAEHELQGFTFKGPGFYLTPDSTILVVPDLLLKLPTTAYWKAVWPDNMRFRFHVYNCAVIDTIFSEVAVAPVKEDSR